jgi:hypothetical protein
MDIVSVCMRRERVREYAVGVGACVHVSGGTAVPTNARL